MEYVYNFMKQGYSHKNKDIPCQDYSEIYQLDDRIIVTACDGHGGKMYVRSDKGSMYASQAVVSILNKYTEEQLHHLNKHNNFGKIKLEVLTEWNRLIDYDYHNNPYMEKELRGLSDLEIFKIECNPSIAYGTTLNAFMVIGNTILCVQIGDGGIFLIGGDSSKIAFEENDENVANITQSLCGDNAYDKMYISLFDKQDIDGIIICTDGVLGPYGTYQSINDNLIKVIVNMLKKKEEYKVTIALNDFFDRLACSIGNGDDVSIGLMYFK